MFRSRVYESAYDGLCNRFSCSLQPDGLWGLQQALAWRLQSAVMWSLQWAFSWSTVVFIVGSREGSIADSIVSLHWAVERCPQ
eukprot:3037597-Lingulodinium_polyedra.AAC.1